MVLATSGPRRVPAAPTRPHGNVGRSERWLSVLGGSALAVYALDRRDRIGAVLALAAAALIRRGATGTCPVYSAMGVSTLREDDDAPYLHRDRPRSPAASFRAANAVKVERSVTVDRRPEELYALWKDPNVLPRFMDWLEKVETIDGRHARWRARGPAGTPIEWIAEVINEVPNSLIAWKSVDEADIKNAGSVHFRPNEAGGTEVTLILEWVPPAGRAGAAAAKLLGSDPDKRVRKGLERFREIAEAGTSGAPATGDY